MAHGILSQLLQGRARKRRRIKQVENTTVLIDHNNPYLQPRFALFIVLFIFPSSSKSSSKSIVKAVLNNPVIAIDKPSQWFRVVVKLAVIAQQLVARIDIDLGNELPVVVVVVIVVIRR
jgi:hypothetical protein